MLLVVSLVPGTVRYVLPTGLTWGAHPRPEELIADDAESIFARGDRLPLRCVDVSTLEMIRGVADTLAFQLVEARERVIVAYRNGLRDTEALKRVRGIGPATAERLLSFISLDGECADSPRFEDTLR